MQQTRKYDPNLPSQNPTSECSNPSLVHLESVYGRGKHTTFSEKTKCLSNFPSLFLHRQHSVPGLLRLFVQVSPLSKLLQKLRSPLGSDPHLGPPRVPLPGPGRVHLRQMRQHLGASLQIRHGHRQSPGPIVRTSPETHTRARQDPPMGAPQLPREKPAGRSESGQHQRRRRRIGKGRLQRDAEGEHGSFGVRMLVRTVGYLPVFYPNGEEMQERKRL